jgi:hypothetical protein
MEEFKHEGLIELLYFCPLLTHHYSAHPVHEDARFCKV